ncbi:UNVERIFIED_CONTAM: GDSL esterase/lipase EXL3 [Sesamum calycinum]|uniref:GDSL esterase/lipase EXL3 n=1 Tax=Sesamum calycinum TaxID=2727403 RepID=A0AAW2NV99_9LAMI
MKRVSCSWLCCVLALLCIITCCEGAIKLPPGVTIPGVFAFGDSIVDQGNNNVIKTLLKCNFPPYGKDFQGGVPTGRYSNGKTPPDLIAEELGITNFIPAYLDPNLKAQDLPTGVSFASGGCGYDPQTSQIVSVISLSDQLKHFKEYMGKLKAAVGEERANNIVSNSLHLVVAGSDDLANTYFTIGIRRAQYDISSYADLVVSSASSFIQELYQLGARRLAVFGIPPIGCLPSQRTLAGGSFEDVFGGVQPGSTIGFEVNDRGCCGTGNIEVVILCNKYSGTCPDDSKYIFWDSYHPTEQAYKILVNQIIQKYVNSFI